MTATTPIDARAESRAKWWVLVTVGLGTSVAGARGNAGGGPSSVGAQRY